MRIENRWLYRLFFFIAAFAGFFVMAAPKAFAGTITVNTNLDSNTSDTNLTFREAILISNGALGRALSATESGLTSGSVGAGQADTINFAIATVSKVITVTTSTPLPTISDGSTTIDGYSQSGASVNTNATGALNNTLVVELNGSNASTGSLITFASSNNIVKGLVIRNARLFGITSSGTCNSNIVQGNFIGMNLAGTTAAANVSGGINVSGCSSWVIGTNGDGSNDAAERNLISGNTVNGITITTSSTGNIVAGNIIGLDKAGTADRGNTTSGIRILVTSDNNRVGTNGDGVSDDIERNVIAGNTSIQLYINNSDGNIVAGNYFGTQVSGTTVTGLTSGGTCVRMESGADNNIIGTNGSNDANNVNERNIISGCSEHGVALDVSAPTGNVIAGNYIGTDTTGTIDLGNTSRGISTAGGTLNLRIGTDGNGVADADEGNLISGNNDIGILLIGGSNNTVIAGNKIGTNAAGTAALGNTSHGIGTDSSTGIRIGTNSDGTSDALERNIISGNGRGIVIATASNNAVIAGNYIGTDITGSVDLGNTLQGILFQGSASGRIGTNGDGTNDSVEGNLVSGNNSSGIVLDANSDGNTIAGNLIGTNAAGTAAIPNNGFGGIELDNGSDSNVVGTNGSNDAFNANERNLISGNNGSGIVSFTTSVNNIIAGNYIGTNLAGTAALANTGSGIEMHTGVTGVRIGTNGDGVNDTLERNIISGNSQSGIYVYDTSSNITIAGNYIGTDVNGNVDLGNVWFGILIDGVTGSTIGTNSSNDGFDDNERNVVSGNDIEGIKLMSASSNVIAGNYIGTNAAGTADLGNTRTGVTLTSSNSNRIGTNGDNVNDTGERNVISGNNGGGSALGQPGLYIITGSVNNTVAGNYIGVNAAGTAAIGNSYDGILIDFADNNVVGVNGDGSAGEANEGNVLSGNGRDGVLAYQSNNIIVAGNMIGVNATGSAAIGNQLHGVGLGTATLDVDNMRIGTNDDGVSDALERNIISGNGSCGISADDSGSATYSTGLVIAGNYIGTDSTGLIGIANAAEGIDLTRYFQGAVVGFDGVGSVAVERNVIAASGWAGIYLWTPTAFSTQTVISGNYIGVGADGTTDIGNYMGIFVDTLVNDVTIGGTSTTRGNIIAHSTGDAGVEISNDPGAPNTDGILISHNSIFDNFDMPIDITDDTTNYKADGPETNDAGDVDTGANEGMNYPVITSVTGDGVNIVVQGTLDTANATAASIEVYLTTGFHHSSGHGDLLTFLGTATPTNSSPGNWSLNVANATLNPDITAIAIDINGNTSEAALTWPLLPPAAVSTLSGYPGEQKVTLSWTAPADFGSAITDYIVEFDNGGGFVVYPDAVSSVTGAVITGLTNNNLYSFRVAAVNLGGTSAYSNIISVTPIGIPDPVSTLSATSSDTQALLTWTAPSVGVTDYIVQYGTTSGFPGNAATFTDGTSAATFAVVTGLNNETSYSFRVYAVNGVGSSPASNVVTSTPNTSPWVLDVANPIPYGIAESAAIVNNAGQIEIYELGPGGDRRYLTTYNPAAPSGSRWSSSQIFTVQLNAPYAFLHTDGFAYLVSHEIGNPNFITLKITPGGGPVVQQTTSPIVQEQAAAGNYNGSIYLFGGDNTVVMLNTTTKYNGQTDTWTTTGLANLPGTARRQASAEQINGLFYVAGGDTAFGGGGSSATLVTRLDVYNPVTDTWATGAPMPAPRAESCSFNFDGKMYMVSGKGDAVVRQQVVRYDPTYNEWSTAASLSKQRKYCSSAIIGTTAYTIGGSPQGGFAPIADFETMSLANAAPYGPTNLFVNATNAQASGNNPTGITTGTPVFSAICNDPNWSDVINKYRIQVDNNADFSSTVWDSGAAGTNIANCRQGTRSADIAYGGAPLTLDGSTYYWRIKFWDDNGAEGAFSETTSTASFTLIDVNDAPTAPTILYSNNTNAQTGLTNPTALTNATPVFSAICNDPDAGDIMDKYRIQVDDNNDFSSTVWDSGAAGTTMPNCVAGSRSSNITFGGAPLALDGTTYYWRIKFWDDANTEGAFSEDPIASQKFTMSSGSTPGTSIQVITQQNLPAPRAGAVSVIGIDRVQYAWSYTGTDQQGFRLLDAQGHTLATIDNPQARLFIETGLSANSLISGRRIIAFNGSNQSTPSEVFANAVTYTTPVTPRLISRVSDQINLALNETPQNLSDGQSGVQFELIATGSSSSTPMQSTWLQTTTYTFFGASSTTSYYVRARARNQAGIETEWSQALMIANKEQPPVQAELLLALTVRTPEGRDVSSLDLLDPTVPLVGDITITNNSPRAVENVYLSVVLPRYLNAISGRLTVDGSRQTDNADGDVGQVDNGVISVIWPNLDFALGKQVRFGVTFDRALLYADFVKSTRSQAETAAQPGPAIQLEATASYDGSEDLIHSNVVSFKPDLASLTSDNVQAPPELEAPVPPPTSQELEQTDTLINQFINEEVASPQLPATETQSQTTVSHDGQSFNVNVQQSNGQQLSVSGLAIPHDSQLEFTGTTSEPNAVVTLIFNQTVTVIVVSDDQGNWRTFVSASQLGIQPDQTAEILIEVIAAKGDLRSDRVEVGRVTIGRSQNGIIETRFENAAMGNTLFTAINQARVDLVRTIVKQEPAIQTTLAASAPVVVIASAPLWGYLPYMPTLIYHFITYLVGLAGRRKKDRQRFYGIVYDSITKLPLALAIVRLYDKTTDKLVGTYVSDKQGRYEALLNPGQYRLEVAKPAYTFPSHIVSGETDGAYGHLYVPANGMQVQADAITVPDVPLDPINAAQRWQVSGLMPKAWLILQKVGSYLAVPVLLVGSVASILVVAAIPSNPLNWILAITYCLMLAAQLKLHQHAMRAWGVVYDLATNAALPLTTIQLIDPQYGKVVTSRLTDYQGRYNFLPEPGHYVIKASKPGYEQIEEVIEAPDKTHHPIAKEVNIEKADQAITGDVPMRHT